MKDKKKKEDKNKKHKPVTSKDIPGNGMAKKAAKSIEDYHKRLKEY